MGTTFSVKQAFWFTVINYFGVILGTISTLFIYPYDKELLGIVRFIDGFAQILYPIMVLGASTALLNFQPQLSPYLQRKLFSYSVLSVLGMVLLCGMVLLVAYQVYDSSLKRYWIYAFGIALCLAFVDVFKRQATNIQKLAVPTFFEKIIPKIALPVLFLAILSEALSFTMGMWLYVLTFLVLFMAVVGYLQKHFKPVYSLDYSDLFTEISKKKYYQYSFYAFAASLGSFFAFRIDSVMIPTYLSTAANGDFNIGVNLANALMIPATGVFALYSPIISQALKNKEYTLLKVKYAEVAKNLFFIGILMYGCVLLGMAPLFSVLPTAEQLAPTLPVLYLLGANVVLNMATGFSTEIIAFSSFYRFNLWAIVLLAVLSIGLNYYILTQTSLGIVGVAYASFFAMLMFNASKMMFIYKKMKLLPFSSSYFKLFVFSVTFLMVFCFFPTFRNPYVEIVLKCGGYVGLLLGVSFYFRWVSPQFLQKLLKKST